MLRQRQIRSIAGQEFVGVAARSRESAVKNGFLRRKCACGTHTAAGGECVECRRKREALQTKLASGAANDAYEREADRIAEQVMATPTPTDRAVNPAPLRIQRRSSDSNGEAGTAPATVDQALAGSGSPLAPALRQDMERRFGHDFSRVRVHADAQAERSAREMNAFAYTAGHDIVFGAGRFEPGTTAGRRLLAHELTHVVQQSGADGLSTLSSVHGKRMVQRFEGPLPGEEELARQLARKIALKETAQVAGKATWGQFWKVVIRRFALRGAVAAGLAAIDGPLPIGDLITLGLAIWTIYELIQLWDELWREAELEPAELPAAEPSLETRVDLEPTAGRKSKRSWREEAEPLPPPVEGIDYDDPNPGRERDPCDQINMPKCSELREQGYSDADTLDLLRGTVTGKPASDIYPPSDYQWVSSGREESRSGPCARGVSDRPGTHETFNPKRHASPSPDKRAQITIVCCDCCDPGSGPLGVELSKVCLVHNTIL